MVGSPFVQINKNGSRILLNTSKIMFTQDEGVRLTSKNRIGRYQAPPAVQEMLYIVDLMLLGGRSYELMYDFREERDAVLDQLLQMISPAITIDSPAGLPVTWPEFACWKPNSDENERVYVRSEAFLTREEFDTAVKARVQLVLEKANAAPATPPPTKPLRKPYTRKPRE